MFCRGDKVQKRNSVKVRRVGGRNIFDKLSLFTGDTTEYWWMVCAPKCLSDVWNDLNKP